MRPIGIAPPPVLPPSPLMRLAASADIGVLGLDEDDRASVEQRLIGLAEGAAVALLMNGQRVRHRDRHATLVIDPPAPPVRIVRVVHATSMVRRPTAHAHEPLSVIVTISNAGTVVLPPAWVS